MSGACPVLSVTIVVLEPKEDSKATVSPSEKRGPSSEQPWGYTPRGEGGGNFHFLDRWQQVVVMRLLAGYNLAQCSHVRENEAGTITNL